MRNGTRRLAAHVKAGGGKPHGGEGGRGVDSEVGCNGRTFAGDLFDEMPPERGGEKEERRNPK